MKTFEYMVLDFFDKDGCREDEMNSWGSEGWELVTSWPVNDDMLRYGRAYIHCVFKREK